MSGSGPNRSGSVVQPRFVFRHMCRAVRPTRLDRMIFNLSRGCLCFVYVLPPSILSTLDRQLRADLSHQPIPPNLRLGSDVSCSNRPMSFSRPYIHCASMTCAARDRETEANGTDPPHIQ